MKQKDYTDIFITFQYKDPKDHISKCLKLRFTTVGIGDMT